VPGVTPLSLFFGVAQLTVPQRASPQRATLTITLCLGFAQRPSSAACAWAVTGTVAAKRTRKIFVKNRVMIAI
jgi:hypothetical protein